MRNIADKFALADGNFIPCIGYGTYKIEDSKQAYDCVRQALEAGYRHIDTAAVYGNEESVGAAVRDSGLKREDVFVTTKIWASERGFDRASRAIDDSLKRLGLDYVDMMLIHWPANAKNYSDWQHINLDTWRALERAKADGKTVTIGVSNFLVHHLVSLQQGCDVMPAVDQIEYHPGYTQPDTVAFCKANNILVEAWSPIGRGRLLADPLLNTVAHKYGKTVAQICVKFALAHGVLPLPKTVSQDRMRENADVFDFRLDWSDLGDIEGMPETGRSGSHPDEADFGV